MKFIHVIGMVVYRLNLLRYEGQLVIFTLHASLSRATILDLSFGENGNASTGITIITTEGRRSPRLMKHSMKVRWTVLRVPFHRSLALLVYDYLTKSTFTNDKDSARSMLVFFCRYQSVKFSDETIDERNPSSWNVRGLESEWQTCASRSSNTVDVHSSSAHAEQLHGVSSTYEWPINTSWTHQRSNANTDKWSRFSSSAWISPRSWFSTDVLQLRLGSFVFIRGDPTGRFQTT